MSEPAKTYYQSATQHFVSRFQIRDNVTLLFMAATGTIIGIAFGSQTVRSEVLLVLPYLALAFTPLVVHHNVMLGSLLAYLSKEIPPHIQRDPTVAPPYEASQSLASHFELALNLRTLGQFIILALPSVFALVVNIKIAVGAPMATVCAYWFAVLCTIGTVALVLAVHRKQRHSIDHLRKEHPNKAIDSDEE